MDIDEAYHELEEVYNKLSTFVNDYEYMVMEMHPYGNHEVFERYKNYCQDMLPEIVAIINKLK